MILQALFLLGSYLLGAIPTGYLVVRWSEKKDIRRLGSQSTGATNVFRLKGLVYALPVVVVDVFKGFVPPFLAVRFFGDSRLALAAALCAVLGHCFPVYLKFRGGKGVATTMGGLAFFSFSTCLISLAVFVLVIAATRYVSLGSLLGTLCFPLWSLLARHETELFAGTALLFLVVLVRHAGNIKRLWSGTERKLGQRAASS